MRKLFLFIFMAGGILLAGCAYTAGTALPTTWRTICVNPFLNKIDYISENQRNLYYQLLEVKVRNAIVNRFQFDGHLKIASEEAADLVLTGELVDYNRGALRYDEGNNVQEYRIYVSVNLKLTEGKDGPALWEEKGFTGEATYFVTGSQAKSEDTAVNEAVTDLARRTVERTIEAW